jgi:hypothetical protein
MDELELMDAVTKELVSRGYKATLEYPGYIHIVKPGIWMTLGTGEVEEDNWYGFAFYTPEMDCDSYPIHTDVPTRSRDVKSIADGLAKAIDAVPDLATATAANLAECGLTPEPTDRYLVFNATDGIYASPEAMTKAEAEQFIASFKERFRQQGYYKTAMGQRIPVDAVEFELEPEEQEDTN